MNLVLPVAASARLRSDLVPEAIIALLGLEGVEQDSPRSDGRWSAGDTVLVCEASGQEGANDPASHEAAILAAGARALHLGIALDSFRIGPLVVPGETGCLHCLSMWNGPRRPPQLAAPLWSHAFADAAKAALRDAIASLPTRTVRVLDASFRSWTTHHFWPHPDCVACAAKARDTAQDAGQLIGHGDQLLGPGLRGRDLRPELPALEKLLCDRRFGFTPGVTHQTPSHLQPMAFAPFRIPGSKSVEVGVGRTGRRSDDRLVALLEALERFSGFRPRGHETCTRASFTQLAETAVNPRDFILHDDAQQHEPGFRLVPYHDDLECNWVWAYSFRRKGPVQIPEQLAYYNLPISPEQPPNRFVFEISNGCALGSSVEEAVLHGLFETIERDGFLTSWYADRACPMVDLSGLADEHGRALIAVMEGAGYEVLCYDVGVGFSIPSLAVAAVDRRADCAAAMTFAAGANPDPHRAVTGALIELCTMLQRKPKDEAAALRARGEALLDNPALVQVASDHVTQCRPHAAIVSRCFRTDGADPVPITEHFPSRHPAVVPGQAGTALRSLVDEVLTVASDVLVVDQSFPELRKLGLACVKVLAPGLHAMTFGHQYRRISQQRLDSVPGRGNRPLLPHIFP